MRGITMNRLISICLILCTILSGCGYRKTEDVMKKVTDIVKDSSEVDKIQSEDTVEVEETRITQESENVQTENNNDFVIVEGVLEEYLGSESTVTIPDTVTTIGYGAFCDNDIVEKVIMPSSVTTIEGTFMGCLNLQDITIPNSVTTIERSFAIDTPWLEEQIKLKDYVIVGDGILIAYGGNDDKTEITIPDEVKKIGAGVFMNCLNLKKIIIPDGVTDIGDCAFYNCTYLKNIAIPNTVKHVGVSAFDGTEWLMDNKSETIIVGDGILYKYEGNIVEDLDGTWNRTNVYRADSGELNIKNQTDEGFDFFIYVCHGGNAGDISGHAIYQNDSKAISSIERYNDYPAIFWFEFVEDKIEVKTSNAAFLGGMGTFFGGIYIHGEPTYLNENIVEETLGAYKEDVMKLLGEDYEVLIFVEEDGTEYQTDLTYSGFISGLGVGADLWIKDDGTIYCLITNCGDARFYTNDAEYKTRLPEQFEYIDGWNIEFIYSKTN